jgi:hypothetical protein
MGRLLGSAPAPGGRLRRRKSDHGFSSVQGAKPRREYRRKIELNSSK